MMMWSLRGDKGVLLRLLSKETHLAPRPRPFDGDAPTTRAGEFLFLWRDEPSNSPELPDAIVVREKEATDFLAWVATYLPAYSPFTGYCRVLSDEMFGRLIQLDRPQLEQSVVRAWAGASIGEAFESAESRTGIGDVGVRLCVNTCAYAAALSVSLGWRHSAERVAHQWILTRELARRQQLDLRIRTQLQVIRVLERLGHGDEPPHDLSMDDALLWAACRSIQATGTLEEGTARALAVSVDLEPLIGIEEIRGPREERLAMVENIARRLAHGRRGDGTTAFLLGYLMTRVAAGSMEYASLLRPLAVGFPGTLAWYGVCAGLAADSTLLEQFHGLARRVARELRPDTADLLKPRADIVLEELLMLLQNSSGDTRVRGSNPGQLVVEIYPGVSTVLKWPPQAEAIEPAGTTTSPRESSATLIMEAMDRLQEALRRLNRDERDGKLHAPRRRRS
jgi:hypothetical protein